MDNRDKYIYSKLQEHYNEALGLGHEIFCVVVQGSQNYNLDLYTDEYQSDIDTKAIILPSFDSFCKGYQPVSTTHIRANNEHIDLKDIRIMFDTFKKQNVNFVEVLFSDYFISPNKYSDFWERIRAMGEELVHCHPAQTVKTMAGMSMEKLKALTHPYPTIADKIEKYGYDCYSENTYFLTDSGYKLFDEITEKDKLATLNKDSGNLEFQNYIQKIDKHTDDNLYNIETRDTHFVVTEGHNIYCSKVKTPSSSTSYDSVYAKWKLTPLRELLNSQRYNHVTIFPNNANTEYDISDDLLKIIGCYVSDGTMSFRNGKPKCLVLSQTTNGKKEFVALVDNIKVTFKKYTTKHKTNIIEYKWCFPRDIANTVYTWCGHFSYKKRLPTFIYKLSKRQCRLLLHALLLGDGSFYNNRDVYYTSNYKLAQDVFALALLAGYEAKIDGGYTDPSKFKKGETAIYHVEIKHRELKPVFVKLSNHNDDRNGHIQSIINNGKPQRVVCFEVPNNTLVTMYGGKPATQGNCKQLHHIIRINEFLKNYISGISFKECLTTHSPRLLKMMQDAKLNKYSLAEAKELATTFDENTNKIKQQFIEEHEKDFDGAAYKKLDDIKVEILKQWFREQLW